jgi:hypothetical protein
VSPAVDSIFHEHPLTQPELLSIEFKTPVVDDMGLYTNHPKEYDGDHNP